MRIYPYEPDHAEGENVPIPYHKIAKVLDGQHRIAGFFGGDMNMRSFDFDRDFDINKVSVDIIHTSHSSFIEDYYYDGKLMEQTGDMEGETKNMEVNWGCLPKHMIV